MDVYTSSRINARPQNVRVKMTFNWFNAAEWGARRRIPLKKYNNMYLYFFSGRFELESVDTMNLIRINIRADKFWY